MNHSETIGKLAAAKARAQAQFTPIEKDQKVDVTTRTGGSYNYKYADLASCIAAVTPALSKEDLALFQPIKFTGDAVLVTTMLVHGESGEWMSEEFTCPVADPTDARSIGSAATYGRRYSMQGLLGIASEEDDDGEQARGGQHEQQKPADKQECPNCGVVGSVRKAQDGSWSCWRSKGGCEAKFPAGPFPTKTPEQQLMPKKVEKPKPSGSEQATRSPAQEPAREATTDPGSIANTGQNVEREEAPAATSDSRPQGTEDPAGSPSPSRQSRGRRASVPAASQDVPAGTEIHPEEGAPKQTVFTIGRTEYRTRGITAEQMLATFTLVPQVERKFGKDTARNLMRELFHVESRVELTEAQGGEFLAALKAKLEG